MVIVASYFKKKLGIAQGLAITGTGFGMLVYGRFGPFLLEQFGWRGTLLICGGMHFNVMAVALLFRSRTKKERTKWNCSTSAMFDVSLLKNIKFVLYLVYFCCLSIGHMITLIFTPARAQSMGSSRANAATLLSIYGIVGVICRPLFGRLVDKIGNYRTMVVAIAATLGGAFTALSFLLVSYLQLVIYIFLFAIISGMLYFT